MLIQNPIKVPHCPRKLSGLFSQLSWWAKLQTAFNFGAIKLHLTNLRSSTVYSLGKPTPLIFNYCFPHFCSLTPIPEEFQVCGFLTLSGKHRVEAVCHWLRQHMAVAGCESRWACLWCGRQSGTVGRRGTVRFQYLQIHLFTFETKSFSRSLFGWGFHDICHDDWWLMSPVPSSGSHLNRPYFSASRTGSWDWWKWRLADTGSLAQITCCGLPWQWGSRPCCALVKGEMGASSFHLSEGKKKAGNHISSSGW